VDPKSSGPGKNIEYRPEFLHRGTADLLNDGKSKERGTTRRRIAASGKAALYHGSQTVGADHSLETASEREVRLVLAPEGEPLPGSRAWVQRQKEGSVAGATKSPKAVVALGLTFSPSHTDA